MRNAKIMTKSSVFTLKLVRLSMSVQAKSKEGRKPQLSEVLYLFSDVTSSLSKTSACKMFRLAWFNCITASVVLYIYSLYPESIHC